jgi:putative spermidine/putrescine transport system substrate-binding protein
MGKLSRRDVLKRGVGGGAALALGSVALPRVLRAAPAKLIVSDAGGAVRDAYVKTHYASFTAKTGIEIVPVDYLGIADLKSMVESGNYANADLTVMSAAEAAIAAAQNLAEPIDYSRFDRSKIIKQAAHDKYCLTYLSASVISWNTEAYNRDTAPKNWAEFFGMTSSPKFSGPRGLWKNATLTMDIAAMGAGVPKEALYPLDIDKALSALSNIRDSITWWDHGAQSIQLLTSRQVDLSFAWNGRVYPAMKDGQPLDFHFNQALLDGDACVVPKGAPNKDTVQQFVAHMMTAQPQADFAKIIPYGPTNNDSLTLLDTEVLDRLTTGPKNFPKTVLQDFDWWAESGQKAYDEFNKFLLG